MKVRLLRDIKVRDNLSYSKGQHVFITWTDAGEIYLGGTVNGVKLDYGIDFIPYWDENILRERFHIKDPRVKEKRERSK